MRFSAVHRTVAALLVLVFGVGGCSPPSEPTRDDRPLAGTCGFPPIRKPPEPGQVADEFILDDVELARVRSYSGGERVTTIYAPYEVNDAYRLYQEQVLDAGWEIVNKETEGFEAEIYLSDENHLAAIQLRSSTCESKIVVYISIVDRRDLPAGVRN